MNAHDGDALELRPPREAVGVLQSSSVLARRNLRLPAVRAAHGRVLDAESRHAATRSGIGAGGAFRPARTPPSIGIVVPVIQTARSLA